MGNVKIGVRVSNQTCVFLLSLGDKSVLRAFRSQPLVAVCDLRKEIETTNISIRKDTVSVLSDWRR